MARQPKIKLAIEKWSKDNPDYKGTVKEMAEQISKKTGYSQTSIRNEWFKENLKNKQVVQNENNEDELKVEEVIFKVNKSLMVSPKTNPLEELIIKTLGKWVSCDEFVKMSCDAVLESVLGFDLYYSDKPAHLSPKKTIKRALRKQVGIEYTFYGDILVAKSIYGVDSGDKAD